MRSSTKGYGFSPASTSQTSGSNEKELLWSEIDSSVSGRSMRNAELVTMASLSKDWRQYETREKRHVRHAVPVWNGSFAGNWLCVGEKFTRHRSLYKNYPHVKFRLIKLLVGIPAQVPAVLLVPFDTTTSATLPVPGFTLSTGAGGSHSNRYRGLQKGPHLSRL